MINILIRTSGRPKAFKRCIRSVLAQTFTDYRIIVSVDDKVTEKYVIPYDVEYVKVVKRNRDLTNTAPWNLYLNSLMALCNEGWIFFLDDDDYLADKNVLKEIHSMMNNPEALLMWKMAWPKGRVIPEDQHFGFAPVRKHIGMPCFSFHTKWKDRIRFDSKRAGDYRVVKHLWDIIPHRKFKNKVMVKIGNNGLVGKREI